MPSLIQELYRFKHPTRLRAYYEGFDSITTSIEHISIHKTPRTVESFEQDSWTLHGKQAPSTEGTIDLPFSLMFKKNDGTDSVYPVLNNYGVSSYDPTHDDGVYLRYWVTPQFTVNKTIAEIRFKIGNDLSKYFSFGVYTNCNGLNHFWIQMYDGNLTGYLGGAGPGYSVSLGSVSLNTWYIAKIVIDSEKATFTVSNGSSGVITELPESLMPTNIFLDGTTESAVDGYFDYIDIKLNGEEDDVSLYEIRGSGYARRIFEEYPYTPSITLSEGDELRFDVFSDSSGYVKFSTDGFYIAQDGNSLKVKGTDSVEHIYDALTDGVWYNVRARFYALYDKYAMKVIVYDNSGSKVWEYNPVYSSVKNPFDNPLFSAVSGKSGLIDNLEVWK